MNPLKLPAIPHRVGEMPLADLIDVYMSHYSGRDVSRIHRVAWWRRQLGATALQGLTEDLVFSTLEQLKHQHSRFYAGKDAEGRRIYKAREAMLAPATVNRYSASLGAVLTWAIKRRVTPVGFVHPCRTLERMPENNEKTRFLSAEERQRLLAACKASGWPRLYGLVLMALTTGARKGELLGLRWADVDLDRAVASVSVTKNNDPRILPLVPAVVVELARFKAGPTVMVFASPRDSSQAFSIEGRFTRALKAAKVKNFTFHCLRHTCASMLAQSGATILEIADCLGHKQLQVTKRYVHHGVIHKAALVNRVLGEIA